MQSISHYSDVYWREFEGTLNHTNVNNVLRLLNQNFNLISMFGRSTVYGMICFIVVFHDSVELQSYTSPPNLILELKKKKVNKQKASDNISTSSA